MKAFVALLLVAAAAPPPWACYGLFGAAQLLLSQLPEFSSLGWVSLLGAACSVGYVEALTALGGYQLANPLPFTPGGEVSGVVEKLGEGAPETATNNIMQVIQTVIAAQLVAREKVLGDDQSPQ